MMILQQTRGALSSGDQLALDLPFAETKSLAARIGPTPTFTRGSGATYVGSDGLIHGVDTSTTSNSISTGSKLFTLTATAGQDQLWRTGDAVEAANGTNSMAGTVTSYTPSTQVLVCNMTSISGTGTFTSWRIGYRGPRFDHNPVSPFACRGLLIEEGRTNLITNSNSFNNWALTNCTVVTSSVVTPEGSANAWKIVEDSLTATHFSTTAFTPASGTTYTASVWLKSAENGFAFVGLTGGGFSTTFISVNLSTGAVSTAVGTPIGATSVSHSNGWWRVSFSLAATASLSSNVDIRTSRDGVWANRSYLGNGVNGMYCYGAQLEAGSLPTSYIPTTTSALARSADVCSITGANFASTNFFNPSAGTIIAIGSLNTTNTNSAPEVFKFNDGTTSNRIQIGMTNVPTEAIRPFILASGTSTYSSTTGTATIGVERKIGTAYSTNDAISVFNGTLGTQDITVTMPTGINQALIGLSSFTGTISSIRYFKKRLPNAKLQALTA